MHKTLIRLHKNKSGRFVDYFRAVNPANILFTLILSFVVLYFGNFLLNQFFGTRIIPLGQPVNLMLALFSIVPVYYVIIRKQGSLEKKDFFTIGLIAAGTFALIYYLPVLIPDLNHPSNRVFSILSDAYADPVNPIAIWHNSSILIHDQIKSIITIP